MDGTNKPTALQVYEVFQDYLLKQQEVIQKLQHEVKCIEHFLADQQNELCRRINVLLPAVNEQQIARLSTLAHHAHINNIYDRIWKRELDQREKDEVEYASLCHQWGSEAELQAVILQHEQEIHLHEESLQNKEAELEKICANLVAVDQYNAQKAINRGIFKHRKIELSQVHYFESRGKGLLGLIKRYVLEDYRRARVFLDGYEEKHLRSAFHDLDDRVELQLEIERLRKELETQREQLKVCKASADRLEKLRCELNHPKKPLASVRDQLLKDLLEYGSFRKAFSQSAYFDDVKRNAVTICANQYDYLETLCKRVQEEVGMAQVIRQKLQTSLQLLQSEDADAKMSTDLHRVEQQYFLAYARTHYMLYSAKIFCHLMEACDAHFSQNIRQYTNASRWNVLSLLFMEQHKLGRLDWVFVRSVFQMDEGALKAFPLSEEEGEIDLCSMLRYFSLSLPTPLSNCFPTKLLEAHQLDSPALSIEKKDIEKKVVDDNILGDPSNAVYYRVQNGLYDINQN